MTTAIHLLLAFMAWVNARAILRAIQRLAWQNDRLLQVNKRLEKNVSFTAGVGDSIGQLATELLNISHEQSDRAQTQAQSVVVVTSTLEELSATARQVAEVADNVYSATEQALHTAETGGKAVGFGIDSIATLTDQIETISTIANELGRQSRRISEIVETITELAEETNLLALNATIEAAGAGEYGRRYAVVAQEVQFLATRSRAASRDVQNILGQIRTSINNTLKATNEGLNEAQRMSEVASQAGEALEQIIENVEGTTYLARQINLTTQQQRTATDQAVEMIRQVADGSRDATARSSQLLVASDRLNQTAASLQQDLTDARVVKAET
jgi:methyl-accepting chemotaxis protein